LRGGCDQTAAADLPAAGRVAGRRAGEHAHGRRQRGGRRRGAGAGLPVRPRRPAADRRTTGRPAHGAAHARGALTGVEVTRTISGWPYTYTTPRAGACGSSTPPVAERRPCTSVGPRCRGFPTSG